MKQINETRIQNTLNYINSYYDTHKECPTYRDILEECKYSSLSLVHSDIKRLKERGILVEGEFQQIKLKKQKQESLYKYSYPYLMMTDAFNNIDRLYDDEKMLLEAQDLYLKGEFLKCVDLCKKIIATFNDESTIFGAKFTLCCAGLYLGKDEYWKDFFKMMITYTPKDEGEKMEKEMTAYYLSSILGSNEKIPSWIAEGRFYKLRKDAYPLVNLLYIGYVMKENPSTPPSLLEPLCAIAFLNKLDLCQVCMDLYLAISYHYVGNNSEYFDAHLRNAVKTCLKHGWLTPLSQMKKSLGMAMEPIIERYDESLVNQISNLNKQMKVGFNSIYSSLVGENQLRDLTFREIEIINFVRLGRSTKEIANKLYLSVDTIKYHLSSIYLKLGVSGRSELKKKIKNFL